MKTMNATQHKKFKENGKEKWLQQQKQKQQKHWQLNRKWKNEWEERESEEWT